MSKNKTFRKVVLCHTDDFPPNKNDKIKGWVESHGGTFTKTLTPEVTHLLCSDHAWRKYLPIVREARRQRNTKVVTFDWLEDSLLSSSQKPKDTKPYDRERILARKKIKEQEQRAEKNKKVEEALVQHEIAVTEFEKDTKQSGYHLYTDDTHFPYSLTLIRSDILKNQNQYHRLKLFESDALPHRYWCLSKYSTKGKTGTHEAAPIGSQFDLAFAGFKKFFKAKTNVDWEARLEKSDRCCDASSMGDGGCDEHFRYQLPGPGKPKGAMRQSTLVESWAKKGNGSRGSSGEVTMLVPSVEVEDNEIECSARTPEGGW